MNPHNHNHKPIRSSEQPVPVYLTNIFACLCLGTKSACSYGLAVNFLPMIRLKKLVCSCILEWSHIKVTKLYSETNAYSDTIYLIFRIIKHDNKLSLQII